jgi:energy-converting hydrogenase Eha subunit H
MSLSIPAITAIVVAIFFVSVLIFSLVFWYLPRAEESVEDEQRRLEVKNARIELKRLKKEKKRRRQQEETENTPDSYCFGRTAAY